MKKWIVLLVTAALLLTLPACGKKDGGNNPAGPDASQNTTEPGTDLEGEEPLPGQNAEEDNKPLLPDPESTGEDQEDLGESGGAVTASHSDVTLRVGEAFRLSAEGVPGVYAGSYVSAHPEIASVDENTGDVTAVAPGTTTVTMHIECDSGQYDFDCIVRCIQTEEDTGGENILASLPEWFDFSSGAGAWSTELKIAADGSFTGLHNDANMGESGEGYPNGTIYTCRFYGEFSAPVQVNDYTYSMTLESLTLVDEAGQETIDEDGVRWVTSTPYGLESADEVLIYLPGTPAEDLPEDFLNWVRFKTDGSETLTCYGLYNVKEGFGFSGVGD